MTLERTTTLHDGERRPLNASRKCENCGNRTKDNRSRHCSPECRAATASRRVKVEQARLAAVRELHTKNRWHIGKRGNYCEKHGCRCEPEHANDRGAKIYTCELCFAEALAAMPASGNAYETERRNQCGE